MPHRRRQGDDGDGLSAGVLPQAVKKIKAAHPRKDQRGDDQRRHRHRDHLQCLFAGLGRADVIVEPLEQHGQREQEMGVCVDKHDEPGLVPGAA